MPPSTQAYRLSSIAIDDFTLMGYSVAGEESVIIVPEMDVCFDIGKCPREALTVNHVLLSHTHADHSAGLLYYFAQRDFQGIEGGRVVVPADRAAATESLLKAWGRFEGHVPPYHIIAVEPGDDYPVRRDLVARVFDTRHCSGSVGYSVIDVRFKLKDEYHGLSGPEIVDLKKQGVEITRRVEVPQVAFLGDTPGDNYSDLPHVRDARVLLVECTFWDEDHLTRARHGKHVHIRQLPAVLEGMNNEHIVITHVTRRTNLGQARKLLRRALPKETLDRVTFLMSRRHVDGT